MGKSARRKYNPHTGRRPRIAQSPISYDKELFVWRVNDNYIDYDHAKYGWVNVSSVKLLRDIIKELQSYEGLTWHQVKTKPHCHPTETFSLSNELQDRLVELGIDIDEVFQIPLGNKPRIMGYRDLKIFYLIWYDPGHKILLTTAR
jgi:hypothetical protein